MRLEQAEQVTGLARVHGLELLCVPDVLRARLRGQPGIDQRAAVLALAAAVGILGVARRFGHERRAAAAQYHVDAVLALRGDQLRGDVRHGRAGGQLRVPLPVAVRRVRVQRRRRGVRDAGGGDEAGRESARGGLLEQRRHRVLRDHGRVRHLARDGLVHRQRTVAGLDAGEQRRGGRGGVRRLLRDRIRLRQRQVRQLLEGQLVFLAGTAAALAFQDAGGSHGGHAHAVADEQDHVAGPAGVRRLLRAFGHGRGAGAVPGRGFRGGRRLGLCLRRAVQATPARTAASSGRRRGYVRIRVFSTKNIADGPLEFLVSVFHR